MNKTRTMRYLFPSLHAGYDMSLQGKFAYMYTKGRIKNCFVGDSSRPYDQPGKIYILVTKGKENWIKDLMDDLVNHPSHPIAYHVYEDYWMLRFDLPNMRTYQAFLEGRYSEMYSIKFLRQCFSTADGFTKPYYVLAKDESKRKQLLNDLGLDEDFELQEYDSIPDLNEEIFHRGILPGFQDKVLEVDAI